MSWAVDRYLAILLVLLAVAGVVAMLPTAGDDPHPTTSITALPRAAAEWVSVDGAPDELVRSDERAVEAIRRTYTNGAYTVWVAVARYESGGDVRRRPILVAGLPRHDPTVAVQDRLRIAVNGWADGAVTVNRFVLRRPGDELSLIFWYLLGRQVIVSDYQLRLHLLLDQLAGRRRDLLLVRVGARGLTLPDSLIHALYPQILALQS